MCRLRKSLKGEGLEAVKSLLALPDSLNDVIEILKQRFGSMDVLVKRKMKCLNDLQPPNESKPSTVKYFHEFLRGLSATLSNAGADEYLKSPQTLDAVVYKLPPPIMRAWILYKKNIKTRAVLDDFIQWFERYYDCAVLCEQSSETSTNKTGGSRVNFHTDVESNNKGKSTASSSSAVDTDQCCFCRKKNHKLTSCNKFLKIPLQRKWDFLKRRRLCFICLVSKHKSKDCSVTTTCGINGCQEKHNQALHKSANTESKQSTVNEVDDATESVTVVNARLSRKIHFRVIPVVLYNPTNMNKVVTWAFIDEGSSPTMMSSAIAEKLGVTGVNEELCMM